MTSRHLNILNLEDRFRNTKDPLILNDIEAETDEQKININKLLMTTYDNTDILSSVPSCTCAHFKGGHRLGITCPVCNTEVVRPAESNLDLSVWMRVPEGVVGFINPVIWIQLSKILSPKGYNLMEWLTSKSSRPPKKVSLKTKKRIAYLESIEWERGLNAFINNFDLFLEILPEFGILRVQEYIDLCKNNRSLLFPKVLPVPTRALLVLENTHLGSYADLSASSALDAARTIIALSNLNRREISEDYVQNKSVSIIRNLVTYYTSTVKVNFTPKKRWLRGQVFSGRAHFCARGVISSITDPHNYEEIHLPWAQGLELLKYHLIPKLYKLGYNSKDAFALVESSGNLYVPLLARLMQELIEEAKQFKLDGVNAIGISAILQRNPSLKRGSAQNLFLTKIKSDLNDLTISLSILVCKAFNADFDGDSTLALK